MKLSGRQAGTQASRQASTHASTHASRQASRHVSRKASKQALGRHSVGAMPWRGLLCEEPGMTSVTLPSLIQFS